ncbi:MAG: helix-turn-helix domain-containing protein [Aristaeellaceae bacterium]
MLIQNLALYEDQCAICVNQEGDALFYSFDYDTRSSSIHMPFQHFHTFYELYVCLCPSVVHVLEGKPYALQTFDIVGIAPNVLHMSEYPEGEVCRRLIIRFNLPGTMPGLSNEYELLLRVFHQETPIFRFAPEVRRQLYHALNEIFLLADKTDPLRDLSIHGRFIDFLTLLYHHQADNQYVNQSEMTAAARKIYAVAGYIHAHYAEDLSLEELSQRFYVSSCYLSHQFKDVTGFTLTHYIQMTRLRNVQSLLINTDMPITEAAMNCGFTSFSQFNRVFRQHIGVTPTQYRQANQRPLG